MKILLLLGTFPKISETFILNHITGLIDMGVETKILAIAPSGEKEMHEDVIKYHLLERVTYFDPPCSIVFRILKGLKICIAALLATRPFPYWNLIKLGSLRDLFLAHYFIQEKIVGIIHTHYGPNGLMGARLKKWGLFHGKLITSFHGYDLSKFIHQKGENVYQGLFHFGDLFLPVSDFFKERLIRLGCPPEKIITHKMGIDPARFTFSVKKPGGTIRFLTVARLIEKKGISYAIKAFKNVLKNFYDSPIEYNIIGEGARKEDYINLIREEGLTKNINLFGWQTQEAVQKFMRQSHIFILPSVTSADGDTEGIPVSLMEAMASGMPVVASLHSGIPELVKDGLSGYLVPERDVDSLAEKILYLLKHPEIWSIMGINNRNTIEKYHNTNTLNKQLLNLYEKLL